MPLCMTVLIITLVIKAFGQTITHKILVVYMSGSNDVIEEWTHKTNLDSSIWYSDENSQD